MRTGVIAVEAEGHVGAQEGLHIPEGRCLFLMCPKGLKWASNCPALRVVFLDNPI